MKVPGPAPFTACLPAHWLFWCTFLLVAARFPGALPLFVAFEAMGLWAYARYLTRRVPYSFP